jgi:hypothetical protein|tara:strand:+ start:98 stop:325 length:228 start_codon:yes stop_codon:yes gene_type:complete
MMATVKAMCGGCTGKETMTVSNTAWDKFQRREGLVQELFPDLSLHDREVVLGARNGFGYYCAPCWDKIFPSDDEE